ncbi:hypothetical protein CVT25_000424 [Psilocybe cyanescens]|uniref:G domain-containing protein n=1 Tax=Psilocybe cyanescens TaxID=93625 RepID=A0A409XLW3_PSICY|nr:hypothetical protein CVT25_000424 [Psilocybe cyanescens]
MAQHGFMYPNSNIRCDPVDLTRPSELKPDDIIIMLIGQTGTGKSNFIDKATGQAGKRAHSTLQSVTTNMEAVRFKNHPKYQDRLILIDTPGFKDADTDITTLDLIGRWLFITKQKLVFLEAIIYFHRISDIRMTAEQRRTLRLFSDLCGRKFKDRVIFATTMWDDLNAEEKCNAQMREKDLTTMFWDGLIDDKATVLRFENTTDSSWGLINVALRRTPKKRELLQFQKDMKRTDGHLEDTVAQEVEILRGNRSKHLEETGSHHVEVVILLLGQTGVGKSTFINKAAEKPVANVNTNLTSEDLKVQSFVVPHPQNPSIRCVFVETPGFDHIDANDQEVLRLIVDWLTKSVMGPTGAGKSTFINAILNGESGHGEQPLMEVGDKLTSCTKELQVSKIDSASLSPQLRGREVVIVDTPGFDDTFQGDAEILKRIADWLKSSYNSNMVLAGVIYLHDISEDRFSGTARRNLEIFNHLCGDAALSKVVLGTTKSNKIPAETVIRYETELKQLHWNKMIDKGTRVAHFCGDYQSARNVVNLILGRVALDTVLCIQKELVFDKKIIPETMAGRELRHTLQEILEMQRQMVAAEGDTAAGGPTPQDIKQKVDEINKKIMTLSKQIQELRIPLSTRFRNILFELSDADFFDPKLLLEQILQMVKNINTKESRTGDIVIPCAVFILFEYVKFDNILRVMGPTGVGKSSFINTILEEEHRRSKENGTLRVMPVGKGLRSCTVDMVACRIQSLGNGQKFLPEAFRNRSVIIVDTPGFDDTYKDDVEILKKIADWLKDSYTDKKTLAGVIYLHDISQDRFTGSVRRNLEIFKHMCGQDAFSKVVIVTTKADKLEESTAKQYETELKTEYWKDMIERGVVVKSFNRTSGYHSARPTIDHILRGVAQDYFLQLQTELAEDKKLLPATQAGKQLRYTLQQVLESQKTILSIEQSMAAGEVTSVAEAQERMKELQEQITALSAQVKALRAKSSLLKRFLSLLKL